MGEKVTIHMCTLTRTRVIYTYILIHTYILYLCRHLHLPIIMAVIMITLLPALYYAYTDTYFTCCYQYTKSSLPASITAVWNLLYVPLMIPILTPNTYLSLHQHRYSSYPPIMIFIWMPVHLPIILVTLICTCNYLMIWKSTYLPISTVLSYCHLPACLL